jgi:hypothetical protein
MKQHRMEHLVRMAKLVLPLLVVTLLAWPQVARSQSEPGSAPGSSPSQTVGPSGSETSTAPQPQPDTNPLAGAYLSTPGSVPELHSFLQPMLTLGEEGSTNANYGPNGNQSFETTTVPMGSLELGILGARNNFSADYLGGGFLYNSDLSQTSQFHELQLMDAYKFQRGAVDVADFFSYTPAAGFGFGGAGVLGGYGTGLSGGLGAGSGVSQLNPMFGQNQSILGAGYGAYSNTTLAQIQYTLSPRTSISAMGTYGFLKFGGSSTYISGDTITGLVGLNHDLSARNTLGVTYIYSTFHYTGSPFSFDSQMADLTYGRKITGRMSLQLYGGPALTTSTNASGRTVRDTSANVMGSLTYAWERTTLGFYGSHFASGGSGVLTGASTTMLALSVERALTQRWTLNAYVGYSRNSQLSSVTTSRPGSYNYGFGTLNLSRVLSRSLRLNIGYQYERQTTPTGPCTSGPCVESVNNQFFGIGLTYIPRPIGL